MTAAPTHPPAAPRSVRVEHIWGTAIGVDVRDEVSTETLDDVFAWFRRVDDLFSTWRDDSEISRIGRGELRVEDASAEIGIVLTLCDQVSIRSDGAHGYSRDDRRGG